MSNTFIYLWTYNNVLIKENLNELDTTNSVLIDREDVFPGLNSVFYFKNHSVTGPTGENGGEGPEGAYDNESVNTYYDLHPEFTLLLSLGEV